MAHSVDIDHSVGVLLGLCQRKVIHLQRWRASITPLASIIGSGFLVVAPLLHAVLGKWALLGMVSLTLLALAIGTVIRFNIRFVEPLESAGHSNGILLVDRLSQLVVGIAYAISVAFYTRLLASFLLNRFGIDDAELAKAVTSALLLVILGIAVWRGARGLEWIELIAVTLKLSIIAAILVVLVGFDWRTGTPWFQHDALEALTVFQTLAILAGMLMVTQGFETPRFLGGQYSPEVRCRAVRDSQLLSLLIYTAFIGLTCPLFLMFPLTELTKTSVSLTLGKAVAIFPALLFLAAVASQLSAAIADTIGGGGLLREVLSLTISEKL